MTESDVAIIGGGIAGVMTACSLLRDTDLRVSLLEAGRIAHGASGHSAGHVTAAMERPLDEIIREYGEDLAYGALADLEAALSLLREVHAAARVKTPLIPCTGFRVLSDVRQLPHELCILKRRRDRGLIPRRMVVAADVAGTLDPALSDLYDVVPRDQLLTAFDMRGDEYVAYIHVQQAALNVARFCEEVLSSLLLSHPSRFCVHEHTPVRRLSLRDDMIEVHAESGSLRASRVVLCTNGYGGPAVEDARQQGGIFRKYGVRGVIGYMEGFLKKERRTPAIVTLAAAKQGHPYFYFSRRPAAGSDEQDLFCIGGPERPLAPDETYDPHHPFPSAAQDSISRFLKQHGPSLSAEESRRAYHWHGLMGYTDSGLRLIGPDPRESRLLYNLGCNGIGVLPSIHGGTRIASLLAGKPLRPSLFDPRIAQLPPAGPV